MTKLPTVAALLMCFVTACGPTTSMPGSGSRPDKSMEIAEAALVNAMMNREAIAQRASELTLDELFPARGRSEILASAVRANVLGVDEGRAFGDRMSGGSDTTTIPELPFDDPAASWRSFEVRVRVVEVYAGDAKVDSEITIGLAFGKELERSVVIDGLMSMDQIVVFIARGDFVVPYDSALLPVVRDGAFLSPVEGERVPWPALAEERPEAGVLSNFDTLAELRSITSS